MPPGWGEPVFERLDADLASAMMGINAVKGVEIGAGFRAVEQRGSEHRDELDAAGLQEQSCRRRARRHLLGPGHRGEPCAEAHLQHHAAGRDHRCSRQPAEIVTTGRHDPCVGIRATPIAEAMLALVLMDHYLRFRAQCGDVVRTTPVITRRS